VGRSSGTASAAPAPSVFECDRFSPVAGAPQAPAATGAGAAGAARWRGPAWPTRIEPGAADYPSERFRPPEGRRRWRRGRRLSGVRRSQECLAIVAEP
jgi:hypothetical protein